MKTGKKVLIALSGGIDSAVSAHLLIKKGYEVEGAFMKNWSSTTGLIKNECPWLVDRQDALRAAAFLRIPLHTLDFEKQYQQKVMKYFFDEYKKGRTPNPDVMCNKEIKFKLLYNWAMKNGFDFLATGHYARIKKIGVILSGAKRNEESQQRSFAGAQDDAAGWVLARSVDEFKDQTYFIYNIKTEQLPHLLFPVGGMKKTAVRSLARKIKLPNAGKKESMGLCFVGRIRLKDFLEQKLKPKAGPIVLASSMSLRGNASDRSNQFHRRHSEGMHPTEESQKRNEILHPSTFAKATADRSDALRVQDDAGGEIAASSIRLRRTGLLAMTEQVIGQHQGLYYYTIGQRQGIAVGGTGPYYVTKKDLKTNTLYVTNNPNDKALEVKDPELHSVNWITSNIQHPISNTQLLGRFRHQGELVPLTINQTKKDLYRVQFKKPQKAVASGQSLVLYDAKVCIGGGVIV